MNTIKVLKGVYFGVGAVYGVATGYFVAKAVEDKKDKLAENANLAKKIALDVGAIGLGITAGSITFWHIVGWSLS